MKIVNLSFYCGLLIALNACTQAPPTYQKINGQTMGTSYHITFEMPPNNNVIDIQKSIDTRLNEINASMSTYQKDSTISKFNALNAGQSIQIDPDFIQVLSDSRLIYEKSHHAFDPSVYPLVELWGFGASMNVDRLQNPPDSTQINAIRDKIGLDKIIFDNGRLSKTIDGVGLDFSAIAKGYGVDAIADVLKSKYHITNYMIEIGGEIATSGVNDKKNAWVIAIDKPITGSTTLEREIITTVSLSGQSMATSGNYRNHIEYQGKTYSHTINPHTAYPVENGASSVSIIADTTALADGWATALTAIPQNDAIQLANDNDIAALFIIKNNNDFKIVKSKAYTSKYE